mgnify:CR=1 FL=1
MAIYVDSPRSSHGLPDVYGARAGAGEEPNQLLTVHSSYLPVLSSTDGTTKINLYTCSRSNHNEFKSRVKPAVNKGKYRCLALDPESHVQLEKEKKAMQEHRSRPKSPVLLAPINVTSLTTRSKSRRKLARNREVRQVIDT